MFDYVRKSLMVQIILLGFIGALIPSLIMAVYARNALVDDRLDLKRGELKRINDHIAGQIENYLLSALEDVKQLTENELILDYMRNRDQLETGKKRALELFLKNRVSQRIGASNQDLYIVGPPEDPIIAGEPQASPHPDAIKENGLKPNFTKNPREERLKKLLDRLWEVEGPVVVTFNELQEGAARSMYVAAPIRGEKDSHPPGLVALELHMGFIYQLVKEIEALELTEHIHVLNQDNFLIYSRDGAESPYQGKMENLGPNGFAGDYITASNTVELDFPGLAQDGLEWKIVTLKGKDTILSGVGPITLKIFILAIVLGLLAGAISAMRAKTIVNPIIALSDSMALVEKGDLAHSPPSFSRRDELGRLVESYGQLMVTLKKLAVKLRDFAQGLADSATEIAQTTGEMAATYSSVSATVTETSTAMDQVREAAMTSMEQAKEVSQNSAKAVEVTQEGRNATESVIEKMMDFKSRISLISEKTRAFKDSSGEIEIVVSTVQDLADQSNLLSVNAAIEAMRAGEQGKGFAVVAQEIKTMADQSRESTEHIKSILEQAGKAVSEVVSTTREGETVVDEGVMESAQASHVIETLISAVEKGAESASVIVDSADFQFEGVDQVTKSLKSVSDAMNQGVAANKQLEAEVLRLKEMGLSLKTLLERYRV